MNRSSLEHLIRAAADITGDHEIVIIGSQAIHGSLRDIPPAAQISFEADMYPSNMPERFEMIEAILGEFSNFHDTYGYYAQGVGPETATLPFDWKTRAVRISNEATNHASGLCISLPDLILSKYAAARPKDFEYIDQIISIGAVKKEELVELTYKLPADRCDPESIRAMIGRDFNRQELKKLEVKIKAVENLALSTISRNDGDLGFRLFEHGKLGKFRIEVALFEPPTDQLSIDVQKLVSTLGRGDILHIIELKKRWLKAKELDPNLITVASSMTQIAKSLEAANLPKSHFSDSLKRINLEPEKGGNEKDL